MLRLNATYREYKFILTLHGHLLLQLQLEDWYLARLNTVQHVSGVGDRAQNLKIYAYNDISNNHWTYPFCLTITISEHLFYNSQISFFFLLFLLFYTIGKKSYILNEWKPKI
jgi:hypothetical protein